MCNGVRDHHRCNMCIEVGHDICYCHNVIDSEEVTKLEAKLLEYAETALDDNYKRLDRILKHSTMNFNPHVADKETLKEHIDYEPVSKRDALVHAFKVQHEIRIRFYKEGKKEQFTKLLMLEPEDKITVHKELVQSESEIALARQTVDRHVTSRDLAIAMLVEKLIPCILHMKLRVFEKILLCLINTALEFYGDSKVDSKIRSIFKVDVTDCMKKRVFGNEDSGRPSQWKFKWKEGSRAMEKQSLTGSSCNKLMN
jgi:hypothetical protein